MVYLGISLAVLPKFPTSLYSKFSDTRDSYIVKWGKTFNPVDVQTLYDRREKRNGVTDPLSMVTQKPSIRTRKLLGPSPTVLDLCPCTRFIDPRENEIGVDGN